MKMEYGGFTIENERRDGRLKYVVLLRGKRLRKFSSPTEAEQFIQERLSQNARHRTCLGCREWFISTGNHHRYCDACRERINRTFEGVV